ncbi:MAG: hypothetical protein AAF664_22625 [Planctomycetota bacterium]
MRSEFRVSSQNTLIETALESDDPTGQLRELALQLKRDGVSQHTIHDLFDAFRARLSDGEQPGYDAILDTMDQIVGWCSSDHAIFDGPIPDQDDSG